MREYGYDRAGGTECNFDEERSLERNLREIGPEERCLVTLKGDEVVYASGVAPGLAASFRDGSFAENPRFRTSSADVETARELELNLRNGSLPTAVTVRSLDGVSRDGGDRLEAVTADGSGFGPAVALLGLLGGLVVGRTRRR